MEASRPAKPRVRSPAPARKRAPGRPARTEAGPRAEQRDLLLEAAIACFVRKGIAATSLREIAVEAHVSPAMLHYYFGDKAQLQDALVADRLLPVLADLPPEPVDLVARLSLLEFGFGLPVVVWVDHAEPLKCW